MVKARTCDRPFDFQVFVHAQISCQLRANNSDPSPFSIHYYCLGTNLSATDKNMNLDASHQANKTTNDIVMHVRPCDHSAVTALLF